MYVVDSEKVSLSPCPGNSRRWGDSPVLLSPKTHALIVPLLCLVAKLHLQWNLSHCSQG